MNRLSHAFLSDFVFVATLTFVRFLGRATPTFQAYRRVNYRCSDIMHVRTPYLEAGSSDRGRSYAKWYLGVSSHHISSESSCKYINPARGSQEREFRKLLCSDVCIHFRPVHAQPAIPELFSARFDIVIAPPIC